MTLILKTLKSCDLLKLGVVEDLTLDTKHMLISLYGNMQENWHWVCHQISGITNSVKCSPCARGFLLHYKVIM